MPAQSAGNFGFFLFICYCYLLFAMNSLPLAVCLCQGMRHRQGGEEATLMYGGGRWRFICGPPSGLCTTTPLLKSLPYLQRVGMLAKGRTGAMPPTNHKPAAMLCFAKAGTTFQTHPYLYAPLALSANHRGAGLLPLHHG